MCVLLGAHGCACVLTHGCQHTSSAGVHVYKRRCDPQGKVMAEPGPPGEGYVLGSRQLGAKPPAPVRLGSRCPLLLGPPGADKAASPGIAPAPPLHICLAGVTAGVGGWQGRVLSELWRSLNPRVARGTAPKPQSLYLSLPSILLLQLSCPSPGSKLQPPSFSPGITSSRKPYLNRHQGVRSPFSVHPLCVGFAPP